MKVKLTSVFVDDRDKARKFYTEVLGFVEGTDFPAGKFEWLTVVSPEDPDGTGLLLEPNDNPAARTFQRAVFEQGIPVASIVVDDVHREVERLKKLGVAFALEATPVGPTTVAVFADTCGNFIQMFGS